MSIQDELQRRAWGEETASFYQQRGLGARTGFGRHPAILVVDMQVALDDPAYRIGADQTPAVEAIASLLRRARELAVPIVYVRTGYRPDFRDSGMFGRKMPSIADLQIGTPGYEIDPRLAPQDDDLIVEKKYPSAFFQTNLSSLLVAAGVDTVVLTGCSTSGCIRAAAIDAVSSGYHLVVPVECVSDRAEGPHWASLFDIDAKYGDVMYLADVLEELSRLESDPEARRHAAAAARR